MFRRHSPHSCLLCGVYWIRTSIRDTKIHQYETSGYVFVFGKTQRGREERAYVPTSALVLHIGCPMSDAHRGSDVCCRASLHVVLPGAGVLAHVTLGFTQCLGASLRCVVKPFRGPILESHPEMASGGRVFDFGGCAAALLGGLGSCCGPCWWWRCAMAVQRSAAW